MSEREKSMLGRIMENVEQLETDDQNYVLGMAEGMVIMKNKVKNEEDTTAHE